MDYVRSAVKGREMPRFTPVEYREIEDARARLEAFIEKCGQIYPRFPEESEECKQIEPEWTRRQWDKVQQLQAEIEYYRKERADLLLKVDKVKPKRKKYNDYKI